MPNIVDKVAWTPVRDRKVLFARSRGKKVFYCVGGKREDGETDVATLIREVREESGVLILPSTLKRINVFEGPSHGSPGDTILKMVCYDAEYAGPLTPSSEVKELAWFTTADMERTSETGQMILRWFNEKGLID